MSLLSQINSLLHKNTYEISQNELKYIINLCSKIAVAILKKRFVSRCQYFLYQDLTFQDIASDAITPLFLKSNSKDSIPIRKSLQSWSEPIDSEESAYFFLSQIISSRIDQEISKKLKEADLSSVRFNCR